MASFIPRPGGRTRAQVDLLGQRPSKTFGSVAAARVWATRTEADILAGETGEIPNKTFGELLERYTLEVTPRKRGAHEEALRINRFLRTHDPLAAVKLKALDSRSVAEWRDRRRLEVSDATVRREWTTMSHACTIAVREWRWLKVSPFAGVTRPVGANHRTRLATDGEIVALQAAASTPVERTIALAARWAIETGMRAGEILGLTSATVDPTRRVAVLEQTKNGDRREVPLSAEALRIWAEAGQSLYVNPGTRDVSWRRMCKKAGIVGLHFHDLRHTAITRLAKKLHVLELARMVGVRDLKILMVYFNESAENIALKL